MALIRDISFFRGEDITLILQMDPVENITGWAISFTARTTPDAVAATITKTVGAGVTITDGPGGTATIAITDSDTETLIPGLFFYDIKRTDAGAESILVRGNLILKADVTR